MKDIVKRQMELFGHVIRKEELENLVVTGFIEGKRARRRQRERDIYISDLSAKDEGNDAHITDPPCLQERFLFTVVQIAAYVSMIWHTMMMMKTTPPTSGGVVTAVTNCCANCVEPSRPQQWGPDLLFLGKAGHADQLDGTKAGDVETNPGPTTLNKRFWICDKVQHD